MQEPGHVERSTVALQAAYDGMVAAGFGQGDELAAPKVQPKPQPALSPNFPYCSFHSSALRNADHGSGVARVDPMAGVRHDSKHCKRFLYSTAQGSSDQHLLGTSLRPLFFISW